MKKMILMLLCFCVFCTTTLAESVDFVNADGSATRVTATDYGYRTDVSVRDVSSSERSAEATAGAAAAVIAAAVANPAAAVTVVGVVVAIAVFSSIFGD